MNLNTESIVNDVTKVVQNGLKDILSEIETKYKLYEESHKCVVKMAECMSKQVKQEGTSATTASATTASATTASATTASASVDTINYVSRADFDSVTKQNVEIMKHCLIEIDLNSKQNKELIKQIALLKQDMSALLSRLVIDNSSDSDEETKVNITLEIEEIKKETNDIMIGGSLETIDDKVIVVACDKKEESEEESEEEEEEESEEEEEEESEEEVKVFTPLGIEDVQTPSSLITIEGTCKSNVPNEKHITNAGGLSVEEEEEEEEEEEDDSDEEKEQLDDEKVVVQDGEEEELYEIVFNSTTYCTDDDVKGSLYVLTSDGDVGDKVGHLVNGKPIFY